jgi:hypothetical protein
MRLNRRTVGAPEPKGKESPSSLTQGIGEMEGSERPSRKGQPNVFVPQ